MADGGAPLLDWQPPIPSQRGSAGSANGAAAIGRRKASDQVAAILVALERAGDAGLTCDQVVRATSIKTSSASRALNQMWSPPFGKPALAVRADYQRESECGVMVTVFQINKTGLSFLAAHRLGRAA